MKFKIFINLGPTGYECGVEVDIDDDALEVMTESDLRNHLEELAREHLVDVIPWQWRKVD